MFGNFSLFKTPFPGWSSVPTAFVSLFVFYIFFLPSFKDNGLLFWVPDVLCWHQKLLCGIYSVFKCSFDEFVGEKVVSLSYSSPILGLPPTNYFLSIFTVFDCTSLKLWCLCIYLLIHHPFRFATCIIFKFFLRVVLRWWRNRMGRPLSPPQIHQKNI